MGISFKIAKAGTRFRGRPKSALSDDDEKDATETTTLASPSKLQVNVGASTNDINGLSTSTSSTIGLAVPDNEVSFTLNLFHKGYCIAKLNEEILSPKSLHPYDKVSEVLFTAIESGWLPGDILDDLPNKFFHGTLICEVRDYRKCILEADGRGLSLDETPAVKRVRLKMSLENVVKDIPLISDENWTYRDLMEAESRILKALRPQLCLDPTPSLDRLCHDPVSTKLNLGIGRKRRLRQGPEVTVTSNSQTHGKKICIDRLPESGNLRTGASGNVPGETGIQCVQENVIQNISSTIPPLRPNNISQENARPGLPLPSQSKFQQTANYTNALHGSGHSTNFMGTSMNIASPQNLMNSYTDTQLGKRERQDLQTSSMASINRAKQTPVGFDSIPQQQSGPHSGLSGMELQWKNPPLYSQPEVKGMQLSSMGAQRYPSQLMNNLSTQDSGASFCFNQQGMAFTDKEEPMLSKIDDKSRGPLQTSSSEMTSLDQHQSRSHPLSQRSHLPQIVQWQYSRGSVEKDMRKDRKSVNSPRVSSGPVIQSPVSSKSGEFSGGSAGGQLNTVPMQKEKATTNSNIAASVPSSPSDSVQRQQQASVRRKTNSVSKTQVTSGVGSPVSVGNMNLPLNANSPSIGNQPVGDQNMLDRFSKIEMLTRRYQLHMRKAKLEQQPAKKPVAYSSQSQQVAYVFSQVINGEDYIDPTRPLSRSIVGGTVNSCKERKLTFVRAERIYQASTRTQSRLIMTEKPSDGTVALQYGYSDDSDNCTTADSLLILPTTNYADLLAAQFASLVERDGYQKIEDKVAIPVSAPVHQIASGITCDNALPEVKQEVPSGQPSNLTSLTGTTNMSSMVSAQNLPHNARLVASGNANQALAMPQNFISGAGMPSRTQQLDQPLLQHQQQQQQQQLQLQLQQNQQQSQMQQQTQHPMPQMQRSTSLLPTTPLSQLMGQNSSLQMGANPLMNNKQPNNLHLQQILQQQQQQQQMPRKLMMNLGVGGIGGNVMGLSGLGSVMGMGGVRGISSPMGAMAGMGGAISPNQMNLGTTPNFGAGIRPAMNAAHAAAIAKLRMATQGRVGMYGQTALPGIAGNTSQMLANSSGLNMLGSALNRANMSSLQRNTMAPMGPPRMPAANFYMNQQPQMQQQQLQQQLQQQQQQLQQHQQQQQQQISSPLQQFQVSSPPVVGSPQGIVMSQRQQVSPQQMGQQTVMMPMSPQQLSAGALQQMNNTAGAPPASPQLSSQTHGSIGSISSSPMEQLQGANKGGPTASNVGNM